jgi:hypothetical protein
MPGGIRLRRTGLELLQCVREVTVQHALHQRRIAVVEHHLQMAARSRQEASLRQDFTLR